MPDASDGARRLAIAMLTVCVCGPLSSVASTAEAQVTDRPGRPVIEQVLTREEARRDVDSETLDRYVKAHPEDKESARDILATQLMGAGVTDALRERWADDIADVWFDNDDDEWVAGTRKTVPTSEVSDVFATYNLRDDFRVEVVDYGASDLTSAGKELISDLKDLVDGGNAEVLVGFGRVWLTTVRSLSAEDRRRAARAADTAEQKRGVPVVEASTDTRFERRLNLACSFPYCDTLMGGTRFFPAGCTFGFPAYANYTVVILSAAHCLYPSGATVSSQKSPTSPSTVVGKGYPIVNGGPATGPDSDWGWVVPTNPPPSGWAPGLSRPWFGWATWPSGAVDTPTAAYSGYPVPTGVFVCKDAATSGTTCGNTQGMAGGQYMYVSGPTWAAACPGDSGGIWRQNRIAVGIHADANGPYGPPERPIAQRCGSGSFVTPIDDPYEWMSLHGYQFCLLSEVYPYCL